MEAREQAVAVRRGVGLFRLEERCVIDVRGGDVRRWLQGMLSNDVARLEAGRRDSGCYATLLTAKGRIVADLQVLIRPEGYWLDLARAALPAALAQLQKLVIADDVVLADRSGAIARLGVEGPNASALLASVLGAAPALDPDCAFDATLGGVAVVVAAFGWSGEPCFQIFLPLERVSDPLAALQHAGPALGLIEAGPEALEILRIEAGIPRFGTELGEQVLPPEARLERAISYTKGCYTGQEILARLRSRGQVSHFLVGLRFEGGDVPPTGAEIRAGAERIGEITSAAVSPHAGAIALAFVRRPHDAPGTAVSAAGRTGRVCELPFVRPGCPA